MEEGSIFEEMKMDGHGGDLEPSDPSKEVIQMSKSELQELVDNLKLKHRAEIDAIMLEQGVYKRIIQQMIDKFKSQEKRVAALSIDQFSVEKYELQIKNQKQEIDRLSLEAKVYKEQIDKLKISLMEYDRHVREEVVVNQEFMIQQLETENMHLRKLLLIPDELFTIDPEEEKRKEAEKKSKMLKSIDDKLK
mmetsp:Transcript_1263/g.1491  ORF Transcript_1263/g.1491 Transcript_1263/m.1491 type:complete len:192 (-) Transcript_1263:1374-1949(-)